MSAARTAAKYALNLLTWRFGVQFTQGRFRELVEFVRFGKYEGSVPAGILARSRELGVVQLEPPKHLFFISADPERQRAVVVMFLLSLLPFCVVANEPTLGIELFYSAQLDPMQEGISGDLRGCLRPMITTRPFPEFAFTRVAADLSRGGPMEAASAAKAAEDWLRAEHEKRYSAAFHLCYGCGRMLKADQCTCPVCGEVVPHGVTELSKKLT